MKFSVRNSHIAYFNTLSYNKLLLSAKTQKSIKPLSADPINRCCG